MNESTREVLVRFANLDTWHSGHPTDWGRFMDFIVAAYRNEDHRIDSEDFYSAFPNLNENLTQYAEKLYTKYQDGIDLLRKYEEGN